MSSKELFAPLNNLSSLIAKRHQNPIVLIPCAKNQNLEFGKSHLVYNSSLFKLALHVAHKLTISQNIYILSTKYELLGLDQCICKYNYPKPIEGWKKWGENIVNLLKCRNIDLNSHTIISLAGNSFNQAILNAFSAITSKQALNNFIEPLKGLNTGRRLQEMKKNLIKIQKNKN